MLSKLVVLIHAVYLLLLARADYNHTHCKEVDHCLEALSYGEKCDTLPIPHNAVVPTGQAHHYILTTLPGGVYSVLIATYRLLVVFSNSTLVVVDFPNVLNHVPKPLLSGLERAILHILDHQQVNNVHMVYSHMHRDHVGSAKRFKDFFAQRCKNCSIHIWGSENSDNLSNVPQPTSSIPRTGATITVSINIIINLQVVQGHSSADVLTHIPAAQNVKGMVHYVDVIWPGFAPFSYFSETYNLKRWLEVHQHILNMSFTIFSGGHGRIGSRIDVKRSLNYGLYVVKAARRARLTMPLQDLAHAIPSISVPKTPEFGNVYLASTALVDVFVDRCFRDVIMEWGCSLGAVDIVGRSHCRAAIISFILY